MTKQLKGIDAEIKNLLSHARKSKGGFSKECYDDADELADQKRIIEAQRGQLKAQIRYKEQVVADEETVAKALGNFTKVFYLLSFAEREELIGLLIKSLKVSRIDPQLDELSCDLDAFESDTPVKWFRINVEFYIQSIFGGQPEAVTGSDSDTESDRTKSIRTRMDSAFIVGLIGQDWKTGAFLVHPFQLEKQPPPNSQKLPKFRIRRNCHLLENAIEWRSILDEHPYLAPKDIAQQIGLSARRVRYILNLANLSPEIQQFVLGMSSTNACKLLSERTLRPIAQLPHEDQWAHFEAVWHKRKLT